MLELKVHTVKTWYISKSSDNSIIHYGFVEVGSIMQSGQEEMETFTIESDWSDRLLILGINNE